MKRTVWTDERIDDAFGLLRSEMRESRQDTRELRQDVRELRGEMHAELGKMKLFMLGQVVTVLAAIVALHP